MAKIPTKQEIDSNIQKDLNWLGTEYSLYKQLHAELLAVENALKTGNIKDADSELGKMRRGSRYLGRSQRRLNQFESKLNAMLNRLKVTVKDKSVLAKIAKVQEDLKVSNGYLIRIDSMFTGELKGDVASLKSAIKKRDINMVKTFLGRLEKVINQELPRWIGAEIASLKELQQVA